MSDQSKGALSQVIANAETISQQITSFQNLPDAAKTVQSQSVEILNDAVSKTESIQTEVQKFTHDASPLLTQAQSEISGDKALDSIKTLVLQVQSQANSLKPLVVEGDSNIQSAFANITEVAQQLNQVESTLDSQITSINVQLQSAQQEVSSLKDKEKYLAILGPFGLIGLAGVATAIIVANNKVNSIESSMHSSRDQVAHLQMLKTAVKSMQNDFSALSSKLSFLKNGINFLSSDITEVINDLEHASGNRTIAKMYIMTALKEVQSLATDAS